MGLIKFDYLLAEAIKETETIIEYRCTMDQKFTASSHTFTINKDAFEEVSMHEDDLAGYVLSCMENNLIEIPGIKVNKDTFLGDIAFDRIAAARYVFASYLKEGEIPKKVGAISPEFEKRLEKIEASMRN
ncbi:Uncharacterised protein [Faecalicoccus pleomorphus]|uniref:Phage protein n=1 Tax=Faecalicoccus pleomorphus TaxID=1323 RepID=A0A380LKX9_9FIRM|nr:hypothetical protein [Faecalicoccus pleomorphus]SUO03200.1 Uncharacterised protein [Faecalicoccus pleomorphus]